ncbi:hypothetical protein [Paenibacillus xylaniclasticus]|uniref:hypothetical protein n=1 Tax=Paenibacillus xylaniclasticus TaxID=588083 RepID=UPI001776ADEF|nr:hypothetical protein [Paenibacillus xylaniclasticus]GFN31068.1 hypothetical protein PCURB6_13280 [Paenibacillus curdlanolyticus]
MSSHRMLSKLRLLCTALAAIGIVSALLPMPSVHAAIYQLSSTSMKQFDRIKAASTQTNASKLQSLYDDFLQLQSENAARDAKLKATSKQNDEYESALRKRISSIDKVKIEQLAIKVQQTKDRYQPLFNRYAAATAELKAAKKLGVKELTAAAQLQKDLLEISVKAAKADIASAEAELKTAKSSASAAMKRLRSQLDAIKKEEQRITPERSAVSQLNKQKSAEWSDLLYALRTNDAASAKKSLTTLGNLLRELADRQKKIVGYETRITAILDSVSSQLK